MAKELYLSIGNAGAAVKIENGTVEIETSAFGSMTTTTKIPTNKEGLEKLAKLFTEAAQEYKEDGKSYIARPMSDRCLDGK